MTPKGNNLNPPRSLWLRAVKVTAILLILLVGTHQLGAAGPTYVSGTIGTSTVWTANNSPYILTGDVTVSPGVTLQIMPGVEVRMALTDDQNGGAYPTKTELIIQGRLDAIGTQTDPILFTAHTVAPFGADWGEIGLYSNNNTISWAQIKYATYGVRLYGNAVTPLTNNTISSCIFHNCGDPTLVDDGPPCAGGGVDEIGGAIRGAYVDGSNFTDIEIRYGERGIWLENSDSNAIHENFIYALQQSAIRLSGDSNSNSVRENTIYDIDDYGIECWGSPAWALYSTTKTRDTYASTRSITRPATMSIALATVQAIP